MPWGLQQENPWRQQIREAAMFA
uniref:Granulocyte-macrophage colony-stimulating factor receptor (hGM-CSF-R) n=1 Tax=Homo sapiens TaxID=9606 RepID=A2NV12_HUMAN|nr:hypothetical protein - human [Homo sapiens]CAA35637.1 unnamed protein product [Homo sapiens]